MPDLVELRRRVDALPLSPRQLLAAAAIALAAVIGVAAALRTGPDAGPPDSALPRAVPPTTGTGDPGTGTASAPSEEPAAEVVVDVAGAVVHPGVYKVPAAARVTDAVTAAGGPAPDADLDQVNLAAKVSDGDRVYVPRHGEVVPPVVSTPPTGPVNINTATLDQLDTLPGVGPSLAQAILDYRNQHGRFASVDELGKVRGIGPAKLESLRSKVRV